MAQVISNLSLDAYIDDFGNLYNNIPVKFGGDIPQGLLNAIGYKPIDNKCGSSKFFKKRYLEVELSNGSKYQLPFGELDAVGSYVNAILGASLGENLEVLCINLVGEEWSNVIPKKIGLEDSIFKSTPWEADLIPKSKKYTKYNYSYFSDVVGNYQSSTLIETNPTELHNCQKAGLKDPIEVTKTICSTSIGIEQRRFYIKAYTTNNTAVTRQAILSSSITDIQDTYKAITPCAFCVGYRGESARNLFELMEIDN